MASRENKIKQKKARAVWGISSVSGMWYIRYIWLWYNLVYRAVLKSAHAALRAKFWIPPISLHDPPLVSLNFVLYMQQNSLKVGCIGSVPLVRTERGRDVLSLSGVWMLLWLQRLPRSGEQGLLCGWTW